MKIKREGASEYPRSAGIVTIPQWAIGDYKDMANLISAVALAGYEGKWIRLSAEQQRAILGKAYFGKRAFKTTPSSVVVFRVVAFGHDFDSQTILSTSDLSRL